MCLHAFAVFPMGGTECPLQAKDLHLPSKTPYHTNQCPQHTHTLIPALVALGQINPQVQADKLKEYSEINANGIRNAPTN